MGSGASRRGDRRSHTSLRVAISAQLSGNGEAGGVEQAVAGLVFALGRLPDGDEEYVIVCTPEQRGWIEPHLGPNQRLVERAAPAVDQTVLNIASLSALQPVLPIARILWRNTVLRSRSWRHRRHLASTRGEQIPLPSTVVFDGLGADVVHFPYQSMERVNVPSIFTPWDFQHECYPEFFPPEILAWRRRHYPAACRAASAVVAGTPSVRDDICRYTGVAPAKVYLMPWGNPLELIGPPPTGDALSATAVRLALPPEFALYPAQTWPHKNHIRLLQALAYLRDTRGLVIRLVCTGRQNDFFPEIWKEVLRLDLEDQVRFIGYVDSAEIRALYRLASFMVFPSLFEGWGFPPVEALSEGTPVACSDIPPLVDGVGDAALLFDPTSMESIANAVARLAEDPGLRVAVCKRGAKYVKRYSWDACARSHRALYRLLGGRPLTEEDRELLAAAQPGVDPSVNGSISASRSHAIPETSDALPYAR